MEYKSMQEEFLKSPHSAIHRDRFKELKELKEIGNFIEIGSSLPSCSGYYRCIFLERGSYGDLELCMGIFLYINGEPNFMMAISYGKEIIAFSSTAVMEYEEECYD